MKKTHGAVRCFGLIGLLWSALVGAHDFWLEAHPFYTPVGKPVDVSIHVGADFVGDSLPNIRNWYQDFSVYLPAGKQPVKGKLGDDPSGHFTPDRAGTWLVGYQSSFSYVDIDPDTFRRYLEMEGLDNALEFRRKQGLEQQNGRERYIRHAKVLVQAGDGGELDMSTRPIGYELEIVPQSNPCRLSVGDWLDARLLYRGKPAEGLLLIAFSKAAPEDRQAIRSDAAGRVRVHLDRAGPWMLKAVKIVPYSSETDDPEADWQSHWANLTFELRER